MDILSLSYGLFVVLTLSSGVVAKLCKEEHLEAEPHQFSVFWIFNSEGFSEKGIKLRRLFFLTSNLSLLTFFVILILQESQLR